MTKKLPVYACDIDETGEDETGISAISFVDSPAVEIDFVTLSNQKYKHTLHLNEDKQILTGVVLQPDQLIYREDDTYGEYYITFSEQSVRAIAQKMMRTGLALQNTTHQHQQELEGNYLTEIWIVEDPDIDKSKALGFQDIVKGSLMCSYKITDTEYWRSEVKTGKVRGFSLEGFFYQNKINMKKKLSTKLTQTETSKSDNTESGKMLLAFELADGNILEVDAEGFATIAGKQAPAGTHELADGNFITIDEEGMFVDTQIENEGDKPLKPNAQLAMALQKGKEYLSLQKLGMAKISKLESEIEKLKKMPTAKPVKPLELSARSMTHYERMAEVAKLGMKK